MVGEQGVVVHLVDMITGEHQHMLRLGLAHDVEILVDRIGGAAVPLVIKPLLGRHHIDELAEVGLQEAPAALDMADQALGLVLREHADAADAGVHAVRQRKVDDRELAGEGHGRLGAPVGELMQPRASTAGQHHRIGALHQVAEGARHRQTFTGTVAPAAAGSRGLGRVAVMGLGRRDAAAGNEGERIGVGQATLLRPALTGTVMLTAHAPRGIEGAQSRRAGAQPARKSSMSAASRSGWSWWMLWPASGTCAMRRSA